MQKGEPRGVVRHKEHSTEGSRAERFTLVTNVVSLEAEEERELVEEVHTIGAPLYRRGRAKVMDGVLDRVMADNIGPCCSDCFMR